MSYAIWRDDEGGPRENRAITSATGPFFRYPPMMSGTIPILNLWVGIDALDTSNIDVYLEQVKQATVYTLSALTFGVGYAYLEFRL